ncbi:MAG: substrate-binding domain-containing protein [Moraxella osloensis]
MSQRAKCQRLNPIPAVIGGVVPVVNIAGVKPGQLKLSGAVLADIYMGKINNWSDARIQALNPGVALPCR